MTIRMNLKDILGGYAIVKKDQASMKRQVQTEAEWIRVFRAWLFFYICITSWRSKNIGRLLWSYFALFQIGLVSLSVLTLMFGIVVQSCLSIWMTDLNSMFCFSLRCSLGLLLHLAQNSLLVNHLVFHH
jgi:hypothetical protein